MDLDKLLKSITAKYLALEPHLDERTKRIGVQQKLYPWDKGA
jgi:hypothetical protein